MTGERQTLGAWRYRTVQGGDLYALLGCVVALMECVGVETQNPGAVEPEWLARYGSAQAGTVLHALALGQRLHHVVGDYDAMARGLADAAHTVLLSAQGAGAVRVAVAHLVGFAPLPDGTLLLLSSGVELRVRESLEQVINAVNRPRVVAPSVILGRLPR